MELELIRPVFEQLSAVDVMPLIKVYIRMITAHRYWMANITSDDDLKASSTVQSRVTVRLWTPLFASPFETDMVLGTISCYFQRNHKGFDLDDTLEPLQLVNRLSDEYVIEYFSPINEPEPDTTLWCFIKYKNIRCQEWFMRLVYHHQYNLFRLEQTQGRL